MKPLKRSLTIAATTLIALALHSVPVGAEQRIIPALTVGEESNDNIYLRTRDRTGDYITHVVPSVAFTYKAPLWDWDGFASYDYQHYLRADDIKDNNLPRASVTNLTRIKKDALFFALKEDYSRVSKFLTRDYTAESSFMNQTDRNIFSANPYATLRSGVRTSVDIGYRYRNTWYKDTDSIDKIEHSVYTEMTHEMSSKLSQTTAAHYSQNKNRVQDYSKIDVSAGLKYEYSSDSNIYGTIGNAWLSSEDVGREMQVFWDAGFVQKLPKLTFTLQTVSSYIEDPQRVLRRVDRYSAGIQRAVERTSLSVTGSMLEYLNAKTKQLENTTYSVSGSISHMITTQSKILLDLTIQRLEDNVYDTYYDLYLSGARYEYAGWENLTLSFAYRYTNNYDPYYYFNSYYNNRFFVELKKVF